MERSCEKLCPDCPNRKGLAKVMGKLTMWWVDKTQGMHKIQRGDCIGTVPVYAGTQGTVYSGDRSIMDEHWIRVCPLNLPDELQHPAPEDIVRVFQANPHIAWFTNRVIEQLAPIPVE